MQLKLKYKKLCNIINKFDSIIIAYSGGVDSSFLTYVCKNLNKEVLAVTAVSETFSKDELVFAKNFTRIYNTPHKLIRTCELKRKNFIKNLPNRCYFCKTELFSKLDKIKRQFKYDILFDGTNYDDINDDFRPGIEAAKKFNVLHPLAEAFLKKNDIHKLSEKFNLPITNRPKMSCLATRIAFGEKITKTTLRKVFLAEKIVSKYWKFFFRVRHYNHTARIEIEKEKLKFFLSTVDIEQLTRQLHKLGYKFITLDLEGYIPAGKRALTKN